MPYFFKQSNTRFNGLYLQVSDISLTKRCGHFLLSNMFDFLDIDHDFNALCINEKIQYKPSDLIRNMCYAQVLNPSSKYKAFEKVIPSIYITVPCFHIIKFLMVLTILGMIMKNLLKY